MSLPEQNAKCDWGVTVECVAPPDEDIGDLWRIRWLVSMSGEPVCAYRRKSDAQAHARRIRDAFRWDASERKAKP